MTDEAKQRAFYLVFDSASGALPAAAEFVEFQDQDDAPLGIGDTGAEWEEHRINGLCRIGPFAKYGETAPETQKESDARFDKWWSRRLAAADDEEMLAWYDDWQKQTTGTESEVFTLLALIKRSRIDIANKQDEWEALRDQLPAMEVALGLLHPITGEPLVEVIGGERGVGFTGYAVFLTASGRSAEGWWFGGDGEWRLSAKSAPEDWSPPAEREER